MKKEERKNEQSERTFGRKNIIEQEEIINNRGRNIRSNECH